MNKYKRTGKLKRSTVLIVGYMRGKQMTKQDYELIGEAFRYGATIPASEHQLYWVADILATKLAKADPKFDKTKFLQACGIEVNAGFTRSEMQQRYYPQD